MYDLKGKHFEKQIHTKKLVDAPLEILWQNVCSSGAYLLLNPKIIQVLISSTGNQATLSRGEKVNAQHN